MEIISHPSIKVGRVFVMQDNRVVVDGPLSALRYVPGHEPDDAEIYVNPADVDEAKARCTGTRRLN